MRCGGDVGPWGLGCKLSYQDAETALVLIQGCRSTRCPNAMGQVAPCSLGDAQEALGVPKLGCDPHPTPSTPKLLPPTVFALLHTSTLSQGSHTLSWCNTASRHRGCHVA